MIALVPLLVFRRVFHAVVETAPNVQSLSNDGPDLLFAQGSERPVGARIKGTVKQGEQALFRESQAGKLFGQEAVTQFLVPERLVRNIVVTIDNVPRQMAVNQRPIKPTAGEFITSGPEDALVLAPENYARYAPFISLVRAIDAKTLVSLYRGLQPLFQQAYEELGHPSAVFNDRLIEVIEHLLATPNVRDEIRLVQPSVLYRYADEQLEKLSAGQKLLIRMGPQNAAVIKAKLREIQAELS